MKIETTASNNDAASNIKKTKLLKNNCDVKGWPLRRHILELFEQNQSEGAANAVVDSHHHETLRVVVFGMFVVSVLFEQTV